MTLGVEKADDKLKVLQDNRNKKNAAFRGRLDNPEKEKKEEKKVGLPLP